MRNLKIICQGEMCKINKPPSSSIKTLKNMTPGKDGKCIFFRFGTLETDIDWSQILKNICQKLLSLKNALKSKQEGSCDLWQDLQLSEYQFP